MGGNRTHLVRCGACGMALAGRKLSRHLRKKHDPPNQRNGPEALTLRGLYPNSPTTK